MKKFITSKSKNPTEVLINTTDYLVDLTNADCIEKLVRHEIIKDIRETDLNYKFEYTVYVTLETNYTVVDCHQNRYWSKNTIKNIERCINAVCGDIRNNKDREQKQLDDKQEFEKIIVNEFSEYNLKIVDHWDDKPKAVGIVNGVAVSIESNWDISYEIPPTKVNAKQILNGISTRPFEKLPKLEWDEDDTEYVPIYEEDEE